MFENFALAKKQCGPRRMIFSAIGRPRLFDHRRRVNGDGNLCRFADARRAEVVRSWRNLSTAVAVARQCSVGLSFRRFREWNYTRFVALQRFVEIVFLIDRFCRFFFVFPTVAFALGRGIEAEHGQRGDDAGDRAER